ncbi:type I polyketide synthase [Micromonospora sp. B006]|uniref:type I polyketide synthase n=1 Tax=Micromonospora sp. B006 TaxID=2201999 RepID=UPI000E303308|nr:type I polyketide synthase [Micromonospora sp. B006]AXO35396.1 malonyl CoA-acyl carrier protein transacylase [Micromonospora sp. B006]
MTGPTTDIAVVGLAGRFPAAADVWRYWDNIEAGRDCVTRLTPADLAEAAVQTEQRDDPAYVPARGIIADVDCFDAEFFGIPAREAELMDPQHRLLMQTCWEALESAGLATDRPFGRVALFAGAGLNYYLLNQVLPATDVVAAQGLLAVVLGNEKDHLAAKVAYRLDLGGPAVTVQTACSTSLVAVHLACQSLRAGDADVALAGGACVAVPQRAGYLYEAGGILSAQGTCRPFDAAAGGTVPGNGVGVVVLKRPTDARRDGDEVYAVVRGSAVNNDGGVKVGYTAPGVAGQVDVLRRAYQNAGVSAATIDYVEAHGTATETGDAIELAALTEVFKEHGVEAGSCSLGSVKANIGHLDAAAGVAGLIKAVLALRTGRIPPLAGLTAAGHGLDDPSSVFVLDRTARPWPSAADRPRRAAVSSFGLGGTNAHIVLEAAPAPDRSRTDEEVPVLLPVSARSATALDEARQRLAQHLQAHPDLALRDVARTLQAHRRHFRHRHTVAARTTAEAAKQLTAGRSGPPAARRPQLVFLFPGQGAERTGMAAGAYARWPGFRADVDRGAEALLPVLGVDLRDLLLNPGAGADIHRTDLAQPALVLHGYAVARLLMSWGLRPAALVGHSVGEYTAAAVAREMGFLDTLRLVARRGALMQATEEGAMVTALTSEPTVRELMVDLDLDVAAVNGPDVIVVSGGPAPVLSLEDRLMAAGVAFRRLPAQRAFHSRLMTPVMDELARAAADTPTRGRRIAVVETVGGTLLPSGQGRDGGYWARQVLAPVRFADAVRRAVDSPDTVLVEVGPGTALSGAARRIPEARELPMAAIQPGLRSLPDDDQILAAVGRLWAAGGGVDWDAVGPSEGRRVWLPGYPFAPQRHWLAAPTPVPGREFPRPEPAREPTAAPAGAVLAPDEVITEVLALWRELLGAGKVTADADFFELGGESLLFIRMINRVQRRYDVRLDMTALTAMATVAAVAEAVRSARARGAGEP